MINDILMKYEFIVLTYGPCWMDRLLELSEEKVKASQIEERLIQELVMSEGIENLGGKPTLIGLDELLDGGHWESR